MKFDPVKNPNYVATIVRVEPENLYKVQGLDNLVGYTKFGMQALVSKDTQPGLYILFSTEVQLSLDYARENNLHRDALANRDRTQVGYLEDNRRVKAISLRKNRSEALLMPILSLGYLLKPKEILALKEGDVFDSIDGHEICRKYVIKEPKANTGQQPKARVRRVSTKVFPEHIDTENYFRNSHKIPDGAFVLVTQKLHGTSVRYGNVQTLNTLRWWERLLRRKAGQEHRFVVGSRRVVKSIDLNDETGGNDYYADGDLWSLYADQTKLDKSLPKDMLVFGELVGFTPSGAEIQKDYSYGLTEGMKLYVYRVATVTTDGRVNDLSHGELELFCSEHGLTPVPVLWEGLHKDFDPLEWLDYRYHDQWTHLERAFVQPPVPLSDKKTVDEGVCIRYDGPFGVFITKAKSPKFLEHETKLLDAGAADTESVA